PRQPSGRSFLCLARSARARKSRQGPHRGRKLMREVLWRVWKSPSGRLGLIAALIVVLSGIAAPLIATHMPNQIDVAARLTPPSASHWFGTDHLGRDLYSRSLYGTRIAVSVALAVTATALVLG